jgi:hypothetical protein
MNKHSYINELEKDALVRFNQDTLMKQAVEKAMLHFIYQDGILRPGEPAKKEEHWVYALQFASQGAASNDEILGKMLRIKLDASAMLKAGFDKLAEFKHEDKEPVKQEVNPGS